MADSQAMMSQLPDPDNNSPGLFGQLPSVTGRPLPQNVHTSELLEQNKVLGALAMQQLSDGSTSLEDDYAQVSLTFDDGSEQILRNQIADRKNQTEAEVVRSAQNEYLRSGPPMENPNATLGDLLQKEYDIRSGPRDQFALEREGINHLQDQAPAADPQQALAYQKQLDEIPGALDLINNQTYRLVRIQEEMDKLQKEIEDNGIAGSIWDIARMVIPLSTATAVGNRASILPGQALKDSVDTLMSADANKFEQLLPVFIEHLKTANVTFSANPTQAITILGKVAGYTDSDAAEINAFTALDIATWGFAQRLVSGVSRTAIAVGNRQGAAIASAVSVYKATKGETSIVRASEAVKELLPSSVTLGGRSYVGIGGEVQDKLDSIELIAKKLQDLPRIDRLTDTQAQVAVDKVKAEVANRFRGEHVIDVKRIDELHTPYSPIVSSEGMKLNRAMDRAEEVENLELGMISTWTRPKVDEIDLTKPLEVAQDVETGLRQVNIYLGNKWGSGGYVSEEGAIDSALRRGLAKEDVQVVQLRDGQHYLKYTTNVPETGAAFPHLKEADLPPVGKVGRWLKSMSTLSPEYLNNERVRAVWQRSGIQVEIFDPLARNITVLNKSSLRGLRKVLASGRDKKHPTTNEMGYWFKPHEFEAEFERLNNRLPTKKEIVGYYSYKTLSDVNHQLLNDEVYIAKARRGMVTARVKNESHGFDTGRRNATEHLNPDFNKIEVFDADEGAFYHNMELPEKPLSYEERLGLETRGIIKPIPGITYEESMARTTGKLEDKWNSGHYRLLEFEGNDLVHDGVPVKHILAAKKSSTVGALNRDQLSYREGGTVEYPSKWFVKQARSVTKNGKTYTQGAKTWITSFTKRDADAWVLPINNAVTSYKAWKALGGLATAPTRSYADYVADEQRVAYLSEAPRTYADYVKAEKGRLPKSVVELIEKTPYENMQKFEHAIETGELNLEHPLEVVFDRQQPTAVSRLGSANKFIDHTDRSESVEDYLLSRGRLYYSKRGQEHLKDPHNQQAEIIDPFKSLNHAMQYAGNTRAMADYHKLVTEEWGRLADPWLNHASYNKEGGSTEKFLHAKFNPDLKKANPDFQKQLEQMRNNHQAFMGYKDPEASAWELSSRKLASWIESKGLDKTGLGKIVHARALDPLSTNPADAIRGMVFDPYLGFYDYGQVWLQSQTAFAAASIEPLFGVQAAVTSKALAHVLINRSENLLDYYAKSMTAVHGLTPDHFKKLVKFIQTSHVLKISGEMAQIDHYANSFGGSMLARGASDFTKGGRIFFELGNKINRLTAAQIAWRTTMRDFPDLEVGSKAFLSKVAGETDKFDFHMTRASTAAWQRGWFGATAGRFQTYNARMLEAMLPKIFGGSQEFTAKQRAKLIAGQALMYGTKGVLGGGPLREFIKYGYRQATGEEIPESHYRFLTKGVWDYVWSVGGADTDFSSRAAVPNAFAELFSRMSEGNLSSTLEFLSGPSGNEASVAMETVNKLAMYFKAEQVSILEPETIKIMVKDIAQNFASARRYTKAYYLYKMGFIVDPKTGRPIAESDNVILESLAASMGIPLSRDVDRFKMVTAGRERDELVYDFATQLALNERRMLEAMGAYDPLQKDAQKADYYSRLVASMMQVHRDDPQLQTEILEKKKQLLNTPVDEYNRLFNNMQRDTGAGLESGR